MAIFLGTWISCIVLKIFQFGLFKIYKGRNVQNVHFIYWSSLQSMKIRIAKARNIKNAGYTSGQAASTEMRKSQFQLECKILTRMSRPTE